MQITLVIAHWAFETLACLILLAVLLVGVLLTWGFLDDIVRERRTKRPASASVTNESLLCRMSTRPTCPDPADIDRRNTT